MFGDLPALDSQLAVVPIVVNAGAALLPAILAGIASFVAILFKPRELVRLCRAKPWIPLLVLLVSGGLGLLIWLWPSSAASDMPGTAGRGSRGRPVAAAPGGGSVVHIDWTRIALARIAAQQQRPLPPTLAPEPDAPEHTGSAERAFIFRGGPARTGVLGTGLVGPLQKAWHYYPRWIDETGLAQEDTEAMILSSPAFHNNRVYGASCLLDPPDSYGAVFCLDPATGRQIWSVDEIHGADMKGFFSSPALSADGRHLLIGQGLHPDSDCHLICIDTETGTLAWAHPVSLHIESSPTIEGDVVYVGCGAIEDPASHKALSHPGFVMAVRISDGQELWRYDVTDPESSPVVRDHTLYIGSGFNGRAVVALDTRPEASERLRWRTETPYPITGAITLMENAVIAGGGNGDFVYRDPRPAGVVLSLDPDSGRIHWTAELPDAVLGAVAAGENLICPVASGQVVALNSQTGAQQWATAVSGHAPILAACAVTETTVYAVSQDGYLGWLDRTSGELKGKAYINAEDRPGAQGLSISSPLVAHGRLYVGSETGGLRCYVGADTP
jgi:outer membrane protein assembly factor BamB